MLSVEEFREGCARFASGITIATVLAADGSPHGLTVSSFTPVSLVPPVILICIDHGCTTLAHFLKSQNFAINVLGEEQRELSVAFSVKPEGRFEGVSWEPGEFGQPLLHDSIAHFECLRFQVVTVGDHDILLGQVRAARTYPGEPLLYYHRNYRTLL